MSFRGFELRHHDWTVECPVCSLFAWVHGMQRGCGNQIEFKHSTCKADLEKEKSYVFTFFEKQWNDKKAKKHVSDVSTKLKTVTFGGGFAIFLDFYLENRNMAYSPKLADLTYNIFKYHSQCDGPLLLCQKNQLKLSSKNLQWHGDKWWW